MPRKPIGPGHNDGPPLDPGQTWRTHVWRRAKAEQLPKYGIETVRRHVRRAAALGMTYPQYASIRVGTGRDVRALLFSGAALGLRRGVGPAAPHVAKLRAVRDVERLLLGEDPGAEADLFHAAAPAPRFDAGLQAGRAAIRALLDPRRLPGDAVVMIGERAEEAGWAEAARLARFIRSEAYFDAA